ncbi:MAG TPA: hypothetical protein VHW71_07420 [Steroidobacteraceae bacterium]|jgi:hypothetical protein|nr:hypothetical protein [Steroidobacteraceae bacterium]
MNYQVLRWIARDMAVLAAATGLGGLTLAMAGDRDREPPPPVHYVGLINDYTPSPTGGVAKGPYEMHGIWTLDVDARRGTASFTAEMNMETSDFAMTAATIDTPNKSRNPHTHHIVMAAGMIDRTDWMATCAALFSPAITQGFKVTGAATVTVNGGTPPFANPSQLTLCITGSGEVKSANFAMMFPSTEPASTHFSSQAIHGMVTRCAGPWEFESQDCKVEQ